MLRKAAGLFLLAAFLALPTAPASAAEPLVDAAWVKANLGKDGLVILDVRNGIDGGSRALFEQAHIPGAVYSDYLQAGWRRTVDGIPGMLPPEEELEALIGGLGIDNETHVVVVAAGTSAVDMGSATRVYWTFKVLGHDEVSILNGGFAAYAADPANPLAQGWNPPAPKVFTAHFRSELVADRQEVAASLDSHALIDNRPPPQYRGEQSHPAARRAGTIRGAANLPQSALVGANGGFASASEIEALLAQAGVSGESESITFCNTGHWASLGWFALSEVLGRKETKLYDGSMVDWSNQPDLPMQ